MARSLAMSMFLYASAMSFDDRFFFAFSSVDDVF
jgi:hypothetical protein